MVAGLSLFAVASVAGAANITNVEFSNGDVEYQGTGGSTVNAKFRVTVGAGEVVEQFETDVMGDSLAPICESVGGSKGLEEGTHFVSRSIKLPPNTGTYDVQVRVAGIYGGNRSVDCDDNQIANNTFNNALRVATSGSSNNSGEPELGSQSWFEELLAKLIAALKPTVQEPVKPAYCGSLGVSMYGQSGPHVVGAQNMLMANGFPIGYGATGYWGVQTQSAWQMAAAKCS